MKTASLETLLRKSIQRAKKAKAQKERVSRDEETTQVSNASDRAEVARRAREVVRNALLNELRRQRRLPQAVQELLYLEGLATADYRRAIADTKREG